jgi:hypothetical protein
MHSSGISIWFFIGVLLVLYGALITGYGFFELTPGHAAHVVLANLHAPLWWGAMLEALGLFYAIRFRPGRARK